MREVVLGGSIEAQLHLVLGGVLALLLAGVVNLSGLNLARAAERRDETAVRLALGSGRARLVRAHLTRHLLLAAAAALGAIVLSRVGLDLVRAYAGDALPRSSELSVDLRLVGVAALLSLLAGVGAGMVAALRASSVSLRDAMRSSGGGSPSGRNRRGGRLVVAAQVALASVLLVGSALLLRSFHELTDRDLGFDPEGVATAQVVLSPPEYRSPDVRWDFWSRMLAKAEVIPRVREAAVVNAVPLSDGGTGFTDVEGDPDRETGAGYRVVRGDYFRALGMSLSRGRGLHDDGPALETSTVVNEAMAESHWPGEDPIGRRVRATSMERGPDGSPAPWRTVVGVVDDVRHGGYDAAARPEMYVHADGASIYQTGAMFLVARAEGGRSRSLVEALRTTVQEDDPRLVPEVSWLSDRVARDVARQRLLAGVLTLFGAMALVVAALGVYGLFAFAVRRRTREIGIRSAIGAGRREIVRMVVRDALALALVGVAAGLLVAWFGREVVATQVVEVSPSDPVSFAVAGLVPLALAGIAALLPATRAARIDPVTALKEPG